MLVEGNSSGARFNILTEQYNKLLLSGVNTDEILVLLLNAYRKSEFIAESCRKNPGLELKNHNIHTFYGLCYNAFLNNSKFISKLIQSAAEVNLPPNLCGLEVSQVIFKQSIKSADFSDYISKVNLLHQLFRRYSLIVQNGLTNEEVKSRSLLLKESFYADAQKAIDDYKLKTIQYNSYDYLRQLAVLPFIYRKTDYFKNIKYLIADDADEYSYAFWQFIEAIFPNLKDYFIAYDKDGSSRCGYLCAYKSGINDFIKSHSPQIINVENTSKFKNTAQNFYGNIKCGEKTLCVKYKSFVKRFDMTEAAFEHTTELIKSGIKPADILIVTPVIDEIIETSIINQKTNFYILSGSEKLIQNSSVSFIIIVMKIVNNITIKDYELKNLLINLLKIPYKYCIAIIKEYSQYNRLADCVFSQALYDFAYKKLLSVISSLKSSKNEISSQISIIYENLVKEFGSGNNKEKYDFFIKEARNFEAAFGKNIDNMAEEFIIQIENSVISENPAESYIFDNNSVMISTPQKIIDFSLCAKYMLWLDISNSQWLKQDCGTLYNAWVFSRDWNKSEYTFEDNSMLTRDKTARMVRKLMLCAKEDIFFYSSLYDSSGMENFGGLDKYIKAVENQNHAQFKIIPRPDQAPVLEYSGGKLGITAVPGAGKTTILMALIIKLIKSGINSENIFVLTYMEAAAKNFKEKLKSALGENADLPNISTIHGLALRIIKENADYSKINSDENFEICDDNIKERIVRELFYKLKIDDDNYDNYLRCISTVKLSAVRKKLHSEIKEIQEFYNFFNEYNSFLKSADLIDYDDMLCLAVKILEENPDILNYYQNICRYIIEDEAQDSTAIQQRLIMLLNGKYNNFVRCGDINQSITSTFTNSDLENFRNFIKENKKVEMTSSQRCSVPIYSFANNLLTESFNNSETKNAFYKIQMKGAKENPKSSKTPEYIIFNDEKEEQSFIVNKVKEIRQNDPYSAIAVLLRLNAQVNGYNEMFLSQGIETAVRTDCLSQKNIYKIIISILDILQNPFDNKLILSAAKEYKQNGIYNFDEKDFEFIKSLKTEFIKLNPDEIDTEGLLRLHFDIDYWLNASTADIYALALNIGLYYSRNNTDKSNSYIISTLIKRLTQINDTQEEIIKKLKYAAQKPLGMGSSFDDECAEIKTTPVIIMTMHKSKGDEFDYVFIPELNEENYPVSIKKVKLKSGFHFVQTIKNSVDNTGLKPPDVLKTEHINENLRLLYVGITRAKKELYLSNAINYKKRKKTSPVKLLLNLKQGFFADI